MRDFSLARAFLLLAVLVLLIPPLTSLLVALGSEMAPAESVSALFELYREKRQNLLVVGALGLFPLMLLSLALWLHRRFGGDAALQPWLVASGATPILLVLIWANFEFWPDFLPGRIYPGFPHGLELAIGPVIFAPVAMIVGLLMGWLLVVIGA